MQQLFSNSKADDSREYYWNVNKNNSVTLQIYLIFVECFVCDAFIIIMTKPKGVFKKSKLVSKKKIFVVVSRSSPFQDRPSCTTEEDSGKPA